MPGDWIICGFVTILFLLSLFVYSKQKHGDTVLIYHQNQEIYQLPLNQDNEIVFQGALSEMHVIIKNKKAWVEESGCPNKICQKMGKIESSGQTIICIPNKVLVVVKGRNKFQFDGITK